jgi:Uma2 family endonuclease
MPSAHPLVSHAISEQDYLAGEKLANERHEYVDGQIYLMAGSSKQHNRIAGNCYRAFMAGGDGRCEVFIGDIKVRVKGRTAYYYPDVVVGCAAEESDAYYLEQPCLIVEVSSDSTIRKDYLEKSLAYQSLASLQAYLIVAQDKPQVDMLLRNTAGGWVLQQFERLEDDFRLPCLDLTLNLTTLYAGTSVVAQT